MQVQRSGQRLDVRLTEPFEELIVLPDGVGWTQSGAVWALLGDADEPKQLATLTDPHALTTDGTSLYWLGYSENGSWAFATDEVSRWRMFAPKNEQAGLAYGDALYGQDRMSVWRIEADRVRRVRLDLLPTWNVLGFDAGGSSVVLAIMDVQRTPQGASRQYKFVRTGKGAKPLTLATDVKPIKTRWDVAPNGDLAFIRDGSGTVARLEAKRRSATVAFTEPGTSALCFCGSTLCTVADGELRRHSKSGHEALAELGATKTLSCNAQRVAWDSSNGERLRITSVPVPP